MTLIKPIQIALAIIVNPTRAKTVVGVRSSGTHLAGKSEFPGGKIELGETPERCAIREAFEETGLAVSVTEAWPEIVFEYPERTVVLHPFLCIGDESQPLKTPWAWAQISSLDQAEFPEANKGLLEMLKTRETS